MDEREQRIRQKAYLIWQEEGCPDGRAGDHWELAAALIAIEEREASADKADDENKENKDAHKANEVADKDQDAGSFREPAEPTKPVTGGRRDAASKPRARRARTSKDR
jgi:hypothetical protein